MHVDTRTGNPPIFYEKLNLCCYAVGRLNCIILDHAHVRQKFGAPRRRIMYPKYTSLICLYNWMTQSGHRNIWVPIWCRWLQHWIVACFIQFYTDQYVGFNNFQLEPPPPLSPRHMRTRANSDAHLSAGIILTTDCVN